MRRTILLAAFLWPATALAAVHEVQVVNFAFQPRDLVIAAGDTVRWTNQGGTHDVQADDGSFGRPVSSSLWTYEFTFNEAGSNPYYCSVHGGPGGSGMAGTVTVEGAAEPAFEINEGLVGAWYEPATSGQGFFFDIAADLTIFTGAWFTWTDTIGEHDWYTFLDTSYAGDTAVAEIFRNDGGRFDDPDVEVSPSEVVGELTVQFHDCTSATATYRIDETTPSKTGTIELIRILPANQVCETAVGGAE